MSEKVTRDEILAMEPGMELDDLIARQVMGWQPRSKKWGGECDEYEDFWHDGENFVYECAMFTPSTDISVVWEAWRKVQRDHVHMSIHWMDGKYLAEIIEMDPEEGYKYLSQVECDTAPEAICKAALLAVMDL